MKNILQIILITFFTFAISSCAKKDETTVAAAGDATGTGTTASGTITGDDNLTGTFNMSWYGQEPSGGCIDNSTAITSFKTLSAVPNDTLGYKQQIIFTSSTTWAQSIQYYSDASCATLTGYMNVGYKNVSVGDSLSGLSAGSNPCLLYTSPSPRD